MKIGAAHRAFTLIEVLIGILILAIALLGLGAVVPVVVKAQRQASDATQGLVAIDAAEAYLRNNAELNRLIDDPQVAPSVPSNRVGFGVWVHEPSWSPSTGPNADRYLWEPTDNELDPQTGVFTLEESGGPETIIGIPERLLPARNNSGVAPQFVWDFIARRVAQPTGLPPRLQLALFVRRVDVGIRLPAGASLYQALTATPNTRLPVGVDSQGYPNNTGTGDYAAVRVADATFVAANRDRLEVSAPTGSSELALVRQPGQRLVDNLGNIYTVRGIYEGTQPTSGGVIVIIDPPVPTSVPDPSQSPPLERTLRQVAFTPQVPAAVRVIDLTPLDPK